MVKHFYDDEHKKWVYDFGRAGWVITDVYQDIADFMGENLEATMRKCRMGAARVNELWKCEHPVTAEDRTRWYRKTDAHIYEGANWHTDHPAPLQRYGIAEKCKGKVLIFGCGIGTEGFFAIYNPDVTEVDFIDIAGSQILNFAHFRFRKHAAEFPEGKDVKFGSWACFFNKKHYDTIVSMDVLEHLNDPRECLVNLGRHLNPGGKVLIDAPFADIGPNGHLPENKDLSLVELLRDARIDNWEINLLRPQEYGSSGDSSVEKSLDIPNERGGA